MSTIRARQNIFGPWGIFVEVVKNIHPCKIPIPSREIPIPSRHIFSKSNRVPSRWYLIPYLMVVVWWQLLTSLQLLFASHVTSSTIRNEGAVEGVSDITRDGDAVEGVTLWGLIELSGARLSGLAAVSALPLSFMPRPWTYEDTRKMSID